MTAWAGGVGGKREGRVPPSGGVPTFTSSHPSGGGSTPTLYPRTVHQPWPKVHSAKTCLHSLDAVTSTRRVTGAEATVLAAQAFRVAPAAMPTPMPIVAPTVAPSEPASADPIAAPPTTPTSITAQISHRADADDLLTRQA